MQNSIKIDDKIPKVIRSTVDERIQNYRQELAIKHEERKAIESGSGETQTENQTETETEVADNISDTFFITQEMNSADEKVTFEQELAKLTSVINENVKQEFQNSGEEEKLANLLVLTPEEEEEYRNTVGDIPVQEAANQLRRLLLYNGPRVHKSRAYRLSLQNNPAPYE